MPTALSAAAALLLAPKAMLRFVPAPHQSGMASLTWLAWDQTAGSAGQVVAATATGGATPFSAAAGAAVLTITPTGGQQAPAWNGSGAALTPVVPGQPQPSDTVAAVFSPYFADPGVTVGIAVTALSSTKNGTWEYQRAGNTFWTPITSVSLHKALLLSANDRIRFVPKTGFTGTAAVTAYAWDGTSTSTNLAGKLGGTNAFSAAPLTAVCLVNTAPTLQA